MMLYLYLLGYCRCRVKKEHLTGFFEFCRQNDFSPRRLRRDKKSGVLSFYLTLFSAAHFLPLAKANGQEIEVVRRGGLPVFLRNGMRRPGIILGGSCCVGPVGFFPFFSLGHPLFGRNNASGRRTPP